MKSLFPLITAVGLTACGGSVETAPAEVNSGFIANLPTFSGDHVWDMDASQSTLTFNADHNGIFTGNFSRFAAAIRLNPQDPSGGKIHAIVDLSSVDAGTRDRNDNLPLPEWFNIAEFPTASFVSDAITPGESSYSARGTLTIKDNSNPATLSFTLDVDGNVARAKGGLTLDRRDYEIGTGSDFQTGEWVGFPVDVNLDIIATR
ncbi:MAG: YceI family protein [Hyphomonadaceae bacterium]|nr:YceI family protein [Hyphomonadaceae bacterium]